MHLDRYLPSSGPAYNRRRDVDPVALGWALTVTFLVIFLIAALLVVFWPTAALGGSTPGLFTEGHVGSLAALIGGLVGSVALAWISALLLAHTYNWITARRPGDQQAGPLA